MQASRKCGRYMYGKLWPLENQALDLKQRASFLENCIPSESLFETSRTKNCCFIKVCQKLKYPIIKSKTPKPELRVW